MTRWITGDGGNRMIFVDNGATGMGVPRYTRNASYQAMGSAVPKVVGARYICGQCGNHDIGFDGGPVATGDHGADVVMNIYDGGSKPAYAKAVELHNTEANHKVKAVKK